jgi:hypothetical protein
MIKLNTRNEWHEIIGSHLSKWKMLGITDMLLIGILLLTACDSEISEPTKMLIPTRIETATVIRTPTKTKIPTRTTVPTVPTSIYNTNAKKLEEMRLIYNLAPIVQYVLANPTLSNEVTLDFEPIRTYGEPGFSGVFLDCQIGTNCNARAFVRIPDPANGPYQWYIVWEVRNPGDEKSKVVITYIGSNMVDTNIERAQFNLDTINRRLRNGSRIRFTVITSKKRGAFYNPVLVKMYDQMSPDDREAVDKLEKDHTISDELSHIPLWVSDVR